MSTICKSANCKFVVHSNINNNGGNYCCKGCQLTPGSHGGQCERKTFVQKMDVKATTTIAPAIQIKPSSSRMPVTAGLKLWYDASDPNGTGVLPAVNSAVTTWKDKSGVGVNAIANTVAIAAPAVTLVTAPTFGNDGKPFLNFTSGFYNIPNVTVGTTSTPYMSWMYNSYYVLFVVENIASPINGNSEQVLGSSSYSGVSQGMSLLYANNLNVYWGIRQDNSTLYTLPAANPLLPNVDRLWSLVFTSTITVGTITYKNAFVLYLNGVLVGTPKAAVSMLTGLPVSRIGYALPNNSISSGYVGKFREFAAYTGDMTVATRQQIELHLCTKWGISNTIPTTTTTTTKATTTTTKATTTTTTTKATTTTTTTTETPAFLEYSPTDPNVITGLLGGPPTIVKSFPTIPPNVTEIAPNAFFRYNNLQGMFEIPRTLKRIGGGAFASCGISGPLFIPSTLQYLGEAVFYDSGLNDTVTVEENGISTISRLAFFANQIKSVELPPTVRYLEMGCFAYNHSLSTVTMSAATALEPVEAKDFRAFGQTSDSLQIITDPDTPYLFSDIALTTICGLRNGPPPQDTPFPPIPSCATAIAPSSFMNYTGFRGLIEIPATIKSIGDYAFANCSNINELDLHPALSTIGDYAFAGCYNIANEILIPSGLKKINDGAFFNCYGSGHPLVIPQGVLAIGSSAFDSCVSFTSLTLPTTLSSIGANAFESGLGMKGSLVIPPSVKNIGDKAFAACPFTSITYSKTTNIGNLVFNLNVKPTIL